MNQLFSSIPYLAWLAPIALLWTQIKAFLQSAIRLVIVEAHVSGPAAQPVQLYLNQHARKAPTNVTKYSSAWLYIKALKGAGVVLFEGVRDLPIQWYWYRGTIVTLADKRGTDKERGVTVDNMVQLRYLRGTLDAVAMLSEAVEWYRTREESAIVTNKGPRFFVRRYIGKDRGSILEGGAPIKDSRNLLGQADEDWRVAQPINRKQSDIGYSDRLFFHVFNDNAQSVLDDAIRWLKSKEWYQEKGLLWRRGSLLFGPPGSGKSSLIRKIGQALDLPVLSFELSTMTDSQFIAYWDEARRENPCLIVMEDIDTVFHKRAPANANIKLSFECVLNCISGVEPAEGVYLFITTNKLEELDEALGIPNDKGVSTRPGRLDTCFHMGEISIEEKRQIANHFLSEHPFIVAHLIEVSNGCTAAQFSDMCSQKALELHWRKVS